VRHLIRVLFFAALVTALFLQACGKSSPMPSDDVRSPIPVALRTTSLPSKVPDREWTSGNAVVAVAQRAPDEIEDAPPWLAELLHAPEPNVRVQGLDAWSRLPGAPLDAVTYALVDPDESVRTRAQELFEQEMARR